jgi:hypothetical protein
MEMVVIMTVQLPIFQSVVMKCWMRMSNVTMVILSMEMVAKMIALLPIDDHVEMD